MIGHSGAYRTILCGSAIRAYSMSFFSTDYTQVSRSFGFGSEFHSLQAPPHGVGVAVTLATIQSLCAPRFGTARRKSIPLKSSSFTPRETLRPLLYLRSQYDHNVIVSSGKVIPCFCKSRR